MWELEGFEAAAKGVKEDEASCVNLAQISATI